MSPMGASSRKVADALAAALAPYVPSGVVIDASADGINAVVNGEPWAGSGAVAILDDPTGWEPGQEIELLETIVRSTLSGVQDAISRACRPPWPGETSAMPQPGARVANGALQAWFGEEIDPVLRLDPIPLDVFTTTPTAR